VPSLYHLSVCLPYDTVNPIEKISEDKGFRFINLPERLNGDSQYVHVKKLIWSRNYLAENADTENSIVMFTDAHDVLILGNAGEIVSKFYRLECDLLFSAEKLFSPHSADAELYRNEVKRFFEQTATEGSAQYLNSGCWIGYGWAARRFLDTVIDYAQRRGDTDDQRVIQDVLFFKLHSGVRVGIDVMEELFLSVIENGNDVRLKGNRIFYKDRSDPISVFHCNGYKKSIEFIGLHNNLFHRTSNLLIDVRAVKHKNNYLGVRNDNFVTTAEFCPDSLSAIIKGGRYFCLISNSGEIVTMEPGSNKIILSRFLVDYWELLDTTTAGEALEPFLKENGEITFEFHILNHIWGFFKADIAADIVKYFYNL
jgi:hypothetical protein